MGLLSALGGIFGGDATKDAANSNNKLLKNLKTEGMGYIDAGNNAATGYLGQAGDQFSELSDFGKSNMGYYKDALGLNGEQGNAATMDRFQQGPGYDFAMDQGLSALERRAGAQGRLQSGNTGVDTMKFATGLADQTFGNWMDRLQGFDQQNTGLYATGLAGKAGSLSDLAGLATGTAGQKLNLASEVVNGRMGANNQKAQGQQQQIEGGLGGLGSILGQIPFFGGFM